MANWRALQKFSACDDALTVLLAQSEHNQKWKQTFVLLGNNVTVFRATAAGQSSPLHAAAPFLGMFYKDLQDVSGLYSDGSQWVVPATFCWLAVELGQFDKAGEWALRAVEIAEQVSNDPQGKFVLIEAVPNRLSARDYDTAIDYARGSAFAINKRQPFKVSEEMKATNPEFFNAPERPPIPTKDVEKWAIVTSVLPALLDMVALSASDEVRANSVALSLIEKCNQVSAESLDRDLWENAGATLNRIVTGQVNWSQELIMDTTIDHHLAELTLLLLSFGSGFAARRSPSEVFMAQIQWARWISAYFPRKGGIAAFVANALGQFWMTSLEKCPFYFHQPSETKRRFEDAIEKKSANQILLVAAYGVGITLPAELRSWLSDMQ